MILIPFPELGSVSSREGTSTRILTEHLPVQSRGYMIVPYEAIPFGSCEFWPRMSIPTGGVFVKSTATTFGANARTDRPKYIQQE